jgi:hypothetical protein
MGVCSGLIVVALTIRLIFGKSSLCNYNSGSFSDAIGEFISDYKEMSIEDLLLKITVTVAELLIVLLGLWLILSFMVTVVSNTVADVMTVGLMN